MTSVHRPRVQDAQQLGLTHEDRKVIFGHAVEPAAKTRSVDRHRRRWLGVGEEGERSKVVKRRRLEHFLGLGGKAVNK